MDKLSEETKKKLGYGAAALAAAAVIGYGIYRMGSKATAPETPKAGKLHHSFVDIEGVFRQHCDSRE